MNDTGIISLGDRAISTALTNEVITTGNSPAGLTQEFISGLDGMTALTLFVNFIYGSGGATVIVVVQTSIDQSGNWIDIARFDFAQASASKIANLSGLLSKAIASVSTLGSETVLDGVLGDRLRAIVTSTGTYSGNTAVSVRAATR